MHILITGGGGYVASRLVESLSSSESNKAQLKVDNIDQITLLDIVPPQFDTEKYITATSVHFKQADLSNYESVQEAFSGEQIDVVFHLASYGMSGKEQHHTEKIWKVNEVGTKNVVKACTEFNVSALIFTSTVNTVYGGERIEYGDESLQYYNSDLRPWDNYANSKRVAEETVLSANNRATVNMKTRLKTCVLRLPGIYGPGERRHFPRVARMMRMGLFKITYGNNPIVEFIHVDNVILSLMLSAHNLTRNGWDYQTAAGKAFFISDGIPINNFEFFRPLTEAVGVSYPRINLPLWIVYYTAFLIEWIYKLLHPYIDFQPLLSRAEVYKTGQTHYFSIQSAEEILKYRPIYQNDMTGVVDPYMINQPNLPNTNHSVNINANMLKRIIGDILLVFVIVCVVMSFIPRTDSPML